MQNLHGLLIPRNQPRYPVLKCFLLNEDPNFHCDIGRVQVTESVRNAMQCLKKCFLGTGAGGGAHQRTDSVTGVFETRP